MKALLFFIIAMLLFPSSFGVEYFIEKEIILLDTGDAIIKGSTNLDVLNEIHPISEKIEGVTSELTQKKGKYWLFSYNAQKAVSASFIRLTLPKGAAINYVKTPLTVSIASNDDSITITFSGEQKEVDIQLQYSITNESNESNFSLFLISILAILLLGGLVLYLKAHKKVEPKNEESKESNSSLEINTEKLAILRPTLNESQLKIIDALLEKKGEASQTTILYMTALPKSSLSRNIELLAQKEIVQKFYNGTSNYLKIHPAYRK
jgi:uncharacterized membrane protein